VPMDTWHRVGALGEPAFQNSWANYDAPAVNDRGVRFRKDPFGRVSVFGCVKSGASGSVIFTLPVGYRPVMSSVSLAANCSGGEATVGVDLNGSVYLSNNTAGSSVTPYAFVDGLEFDTELVTAMPTGPQGPQGLPGAPGGNATVPMDTWHLVGAAGEPAFTNGWSTYDSGRPARFRKDPLGKVMVDGLVKGGASGTAVFTLPVGYRPANGRYDYAIVGNCAGGVSNIEVLDTGAVIMSNAGGSSSANVTTYAFLDGIDIDTESVTAMPTGPQGPQGLPGAPGAPGAPGNSATVPMDPWHLVGAAGEPSYGSGWAAWGASGFPGARFRKDPLGKVMLSGLARGGASGSAIFTLPVGFRPPAASGFTTIASGNGTATVGVNADGTVVASNWVAPASVTGYVWLDGITFDTESVTAMPTGPKGDKGDTGGNATVPMDTLHVVGAAGEPAFVNGWSGTASFRKDPLGKVRLSGSIAGSTMSPIFTLPAGFRIPVAKTYTVNSSNQLGIVAIDTNGDVRPFIGLAGNVQLDGIEFDTLSVTQMPTGPTGPQGPQGVPGNMATVPMDTWHVVGAAGEPVLGAGWTNIATGGLDPAIAFRKDPLGKVWIRGTAMAGTAGTLGTPIFTLPVGYRPSARVRHVGMGAQSATAWVQVNVGSDGAVTGWVDSIGTPVGLDEVHFDTDTVTAMPTGPQGAQGPPGTGVAFVGQICPTAFSNPEPGWLICDGTELLVGQHPTLRAKLVAEGSKFGTGFSGGPLLPDLQNRFVRGGFYDTGFNPVGGKGGADTVALKMAEMPAHNHGGSTGVDTPDHAHYSQSGPSGGFLAYGGGGNAFMYVGNPWGAQGTGPFVGQVATGGASAQHSHSVPVAGGGAVNAGTPTAHENKPPFLTLYYAIYAGD
jgi:microcystin-dependent protein